MGRPSRALPSSAATGESGGIGQCCRWRLAAAVAGGFNCPAVRVKRSGFARQAKLKKVASNIRRCSSLSLKQDSHGRCPVNSLGGCAHHATRIQSMQLCSNNDVAACCSILQGQRLQTHMPPLPL